MKINGVGKVIKKDITRQFIQAERVNDDRLIMTKVKVAPVDLIVDVYATIDCDDKKVGRIHEHVENILYQDSKGKINCIIIGNWQSIIGSCRDGKKVGSYGFGKRNDKGKAFGSLSNKYTNCDE